VRSVSPTLPLIPPVIDPKVLETVQDALLADLQVDVEYTSRDRKSKQLRLHPLAMVCRGPVTYLVATAKEYEEVRIFAVHRISEATRTNESVKRPANFDLDEYIQADGFQFGNGKILHLSAWIHQDLANILEETPLSKDQKIVAEDEWLKLTATVTDSWQLSWWIMSWGDSIEVIAPVTYRRKIASRLANAAAQYEDVEG
jgi:predicted DNA-binding transcriptional regulator YafY